MQRPNQHLIDKATTLLRDYENRLKREHLEGPEDNPIELEVLNLCKCWDEINPYAHHIHLVSILKTVAKPKVQKVLLEEMDERELSTFVDLLENLITFFRSMESTQAEVALQIRDITHYPYYYDDAELIGIIEDTGRKMKSLDAAKIPVCKN